MWLFLTVEPPIINVGIARLPEVKLNLAAFGLAFSIALILKSPVLQLLSATTALADGRRSYKRLLTFAHAMVGTLTALYGLIARYAMGVPMEIALASGPAFMLLTLFAGAIVISAGALTAAITAFALAIPVLRGPIESAEGSLVPWRDLLAFYLPLAMTKFLLLSLRAVMSAGLARTPNPENALALWPVVYSVLIMFGSLASAYQEVVISQLRSPTDRIALMRFARALAVFLTFGLLLLAATPGSSPTLPVST